MKTALKQLAPHIVPCLWFLRCDRRSATYRWHPVMGEVPLCHRCADKYARSIGGQYPHYHHLACAIELTVGYERHRRCGGKADSPEMRERWRRVAL